MKTKKQTKINDFGFHECFIGHGIVLELERRPLIDSGI